MISATIRTNHKPIQWCPHFKEVWSRKHYRVRELKSVHAETRHHLMSQVVRLLLAILGGICCMGMTTRIALAPLTKIETLWGKRLMNLHQWPQVKAWTILAARTKPRRRPTRTLCHTAASLQVIRVTTSLVSWRNTSHNLVVVCRNYNWIRMPLSSAPSSQDTCSPLSTLNF